MVATYVVTLATFFKIVDQSILTLMDILTKQMTLLIYINKFLMVVNKESMKIIGYIVLYTGKNSIARTI